ncbi:hypothetical protein YPPY89_0946, partial [Yersinia pestis PY-89]
MLAENILLIPANGLSFFRSGISFTG